MKLLLFDVDGTLLQVNGGVHTAVAHAVSTITGHSVSTDGVTFSGRTDPAIFRDVLDASGVANPEAVLDDVIQSYVQHAHQTVGTDEVECLPGVHELLGFLAQHENVHLGLVTGNVEPMAKHKLRSVDLASHFPFGAFGSDHANRDRLPKMAMRRAATQTGRSFDPEHTVVIGDTQRDIDCARAAGAHAAAVCTGGSPRADLYSHVPDLLFDSFRNPSKVAEKLLNV